MNKQIIGSLAGGIIIGIALMLVYNAVSPAALPTPPATPTPTPIVEESPEPGESNITYPLEDFPVTSPVIVAGTVVGVFENQFMISVLDANGEELGQAQATAYGDIGTPAAFVQEVAFTQPITTTGTIEIWDESARDGSKQVIDSVEVQFQ